LNARRKTLNERPKTIKEYLEKLGQALGSKATIIVFGGRAIHGLETNEARDLDILIVVDDTENPQDIEELAYKLKPKHLPADIILAKKNQAKNNITRQMLRHRIVISDPLNLNKELKTHKPRERRS